MKVGHIVLNARERAGISQHELAKRAGTAQSAISRIERDRISPTVDTLERLVAHAGSTLRIGLDTPTEELADHARLSP